MNQTPIHELETLMSWRRFLARLRAFAAVGPAAFYVESRVGGKGLIYRYSTGALPELCRVRIDDPNDAEISASHTGFLQMLENRFGHALG